MRLSLKALHYFATAVDRGSVAHAATDLNIVPSAVLAAVNQVEECFKLQLVTRQRSKGIVLTATGQMLIPKIRRLLQEYEHLMDDGANLRTSLTGQLTVGYYAPVAPAFIPEIVSSLVHGNSNVALKFVECDNSVAQAGLMAGKFDVIICVSSNLKPEISYKTLLEMPAYLLMPKSHPLAEAGHVSLEQMSGEKFVLLDLPVVSEHYSHLFEWTGVTPRLVATATSLEMVRSLVGAGLGCSILHMHPKTWQTYSGHSVVGVPIVPKPDPLRLVLGYLPGQSRRIVEAFVSETTKQFNSDKVSQFLVG
ncbi:LysR family transcriptional regulator [Rhodobacter sp. HX-7-19]|uniref:LysR family transcriptional regulator n=1 Tax=Paragemmobacter kunshanensis TaxID=2583234 RepID=A0A6M1U9I2_9RHOB|nr:LysR family transcriptional regulator [Rhodobacter kunshanensis]NGQ93495.1 LysR family transcriptional regulator [Rhodobacter kunshanensis]